MKVGWLLAPWLIAEVLLLRALRAAAAAGGGGVRHMEMVIRRGMLLWGDGITTRNEWDGVATDAETHGFWVLELLFLVLRASFLSPQASVATSVLRASAGLQTGFPQGIMLFRHLWQRASLPRSAAARYTEIPRQQQRYLSSSRYTSQHRQQRDAQIREIHRQTAQQAPTHAGE